MLNSTQLTDGLEDFFSNPPNNTVACAERWANIIHEYASGVTPPSLTVSTAKVSFQASLLSAFSGPMLSVLPAMEAAFVAFAAQVGAGMAPVFTAAPPIGVVGFASIPPAASFSAAASAWSSRIDTWFKTGTATLNSPPGTTVGWL